MLRRFAPPLVLAGLGLLFFGELLLHPSRTLYADHSDLLAYHVPVKRFLVRSWQETGELPLWCPYSFGGTPFVHDIQVSAFYPPHLPLYALPERYAGCALSWVVVLHVIAAGLCMYAYARAQGLGQGGSLVAGLGYMFAGKWMFHLLAAGHVNVAPLAWLPLVLLLLEGAVGGAGVLRAVGAGAVFALIVLGTHPQFTFYAGLFVALWALGPALVRAGYLGGDGPRSWRRTAAALGRWAGCGAVAAVVALALSAVQLLPTLEASRHTGRAYTGPTSWDAGATFVSLLELLGPARLDFGWETHGGLGLTWLMAAALAVVGGSGLVRFRAAVGLFPIVFALGGWFVLQPLPGFRLFQVPARMVMLTALPLALLAGTASDWLFTAAKRPAWLRRSAAAVASVAVLGLVLIVAQLFHDGLRPHTYWAVVAATVLVVLIMLSRFSGAVGPAWKVTWAAVLLAELWGLAWPLLAVRPDDDLYLPTESARYLQARAASHGRALDRDVPRRQTDTPLGYALPLLLNIEPVRGYNPLDVHQYKQYLHFISDDDTEAPPHATVANFTVRNRPLLDLLGVRYLVQPDSLPAEMAGWEPVAHDPQPRAYCFVSGGIQPLPPYTIYENDRAFPRAFLVYAAAPMPGRAQALSALKATNFREQVLLEGPPFSEEQAGTPRSELRPATLRDYRPNRVVIDAESDSAGYLVLADVWYPGWAATVNGQPAPVYRANYLFRAVAVPAGRSEVVFTFDPASYRWGRLISAVALAAVAAAGALSGALSLRRGRPVRPNTSFSAGQAYAGELG